MHYIYINQSKEKKEMIPTYFLALTYTEIDISAIVKVIINSFCAIMVLITLIIGGWETYQGLTDDSPSKRKHGITVLIVGFSVPALVFTIANMLL